MIQVETIPVGMIQANCYFLIKGQNVIIVDPGDESSKLIKLITKGKYQPQAIICTHGHYDHVGAVKDLQEKYDVPVYLHEADAALKELMISEFGVTDFITDNKAALGFLNDYGFQVMETPGHTQGGICFYNDDMVFTGDTIFGDGYLGRTDLFGGDGSQLQASVKKFFTKLATERYLYAGHGPKSTVDIERRYHGC